MSLSRYLVTLKSVCPVYPEKADVGHPPISFSSCKAGARMRSHQVTSGERVMAQVNGEHCIYTNL